jgi:hypothetical protein
VLPTPLLQQLAIISNHFSNSEGGPEKAEKAFKAEITRVTSRPLEARAISCSKNVPKV